MTMSTLRQHEMATFYRPSILEAPIALPPAIHGERGGLFSRLGRAIAQVREETAATEQQRRIADSRRWSSDLRPFRTGGSY